MLTRKVTCKVLDNFPKPVTTTKVLADAKTFDRINKSNDKINKLNDYQYIEDFYKSKEWATARYQALLTQLHICACCKRTREDGIILHVDHVIPLKKDFSLRTTQSNLQILCGACNFGKGSWNETDWKKK